MQRKSEKKRLPLGKATAADRDTREVIKLGTTKEARIDVSARLTHPSILFCTSATRTLNEAVAIRDEMAASLRDPATSGTGRRWSSDVLNRLAES